MNGVGTRKPSVTSTYGGRSGGRSSSRSSSRPMMNGYDQQLQGGHRSNQVYPVTSQMHHDSNNRRQSISRYDQASALHANDPVTMHLLMETAIGDSQSYAVISVEEVEKLKRELPIIDGRIEATRRQLAIESKVRDAASSLNRLDSKPGHRRGPSSARGENDEAIAAAYQKCDDLNSELRQLEQRQQDVHRRLLEHTAGVLQKTHKGFLDKDPPTQRNGFENRGDGYGGLDLVSEMDDSSFYRTLDSLLDGGSTKQDSNTFQQQKAAIMETERRVWDLNQRLRDAISQANSNSSTISEPPDPTHSDNDNPHAALQSQISYMENGIERMQNGHVEVVSSYKSASHRSEERLEDLNSQLHGLVIKSSQDSNVQHPLPPEISGRGPDGQIAFLENGLDALEQSVFRLKAEHQNFASRSGVHAEKADHYEKTLHGLWPSISDGETFSIDFFSSKVLSLNTKVSDLTTQKDILNRQIQQQREINNKSDDEKDAKLSSVNAELEQAKAEASKARQEMQDFEGEMVRLQTELTVARAELDGAYGTRAQRAAEVAQHPALQQEIAELKNELDAARSKSGDSVELKQLNEALQSELRSMAADYEVLTKSSIDHEKEVEKLENAVDSFRDRYEALETQLAEERVSKLGVKSPGTPGDRGSTSTERGATSTSVLKNEFKKMMKDTRAENMRALRVRNLSCHGATLLTVF